MKKSAIIVLTVAAAMAVRVPCMLFMSKTVQALAGGGLTEQARAVVAMACDGAMMAVLAWLAAGQLKLDRSRVFPVSWPRGAVAVGAALGVLVAVLNVFVVHRWFPSAEASSATVATYLSGGASPLWSLVLGLGLAVFAPVVEEIYFRGLIQNALDEAAPYAGLLGATFLFVTEHPGSLNSPATWILGSALGLIYHRTRSVSAAIACHAVNNGLALYGLPHLTR